MSTQDFASIIQAVKERVRKLDSKSIPLIWYTPPDNTLLQFCVQDDDVDYGAVSQNRGADGYFPIPGKASALTYKPELNPEKPLEVETLLDDQSVEIKFFGLDELDAVAQAMFDFAMPEVLPEIFAAAQALRETASEEQTAAPADSANPAE